MIDKCVCTVEEHGHPAAGCSTPARYQVRWDTEKGPIYHWYCSGCAHQIMEPAAKEEKPS